jgi:hypothetical protein
MTRKSYPHHVSLYLSAEQHQRLRQLVKRSGIDASKHLRAALDLYLEHQQPKRKAKPAAATPKPKPERAIPTGEVLPAVYIWGD